jgi:hypothetical protein
MTTFELTDYLIVWLGLLLFFSRHMEDRSLTNYIVIPFWVGVVAVPYYWLLRWMFFKA